MACPVLTCCPQRKQGRHHPGEVIPRARRATVRAPSLQLLADDGVEFLEGLFEGERLPRDQ